MSIGSFGSKSLGYSDTVVGSLNTGIESINQLETIIIEPSEPVELDVIGWDSVDLVGWSATESVGWSI